MEQNNPGNFSPSPPAQAAMPSEAAAQSEQKSVAPDQTQDNLGRFPLRPLGFLVILLVVVLVPGLIFLNRREAKKQSAEELAASLSQPERNTRPFVSCPVLPVRCVAGQFVEENTDGKMIYGFKFGGLPAGSQVFAVMSGEKTVESDGSFLITNSERGIELRYVFSGDFGLSQESLASYDEGAVIGTFSGDASDLILYVRNIETGQPVRLGIGASGDFLTNLN